jgi:hypothetical protein
MSTSTNQGNLSKRDCQTLQGVLKVKHKVTAQKDNIKKLQFSKMQKMDAHFKVPSLNLHENNFDPA